MPMVVILPRTGRSPFQLYLIGLISLSGIAIATGQSTNPLVVEMGQPYSTCWGSALSIGGISVLLGIYWPWEQFTGLLIERSGLVALGGACLIWTILAVRRVHMDAPGTLSVIFTFGLFLACWAQWHWINKNVNRVIKAVNDK